MAVVDILSQLKRDEGLRLTPYKDSVGKLTIGYGRNLDAEGISQEEAEFMLSNDIASHTTTLVKALPWVGALDEVRRAVLENMAFNMGVPGLLQFNRTLAMIAAHNFDGASEAMLESKWATEVGKEPPSEHEPLGGRAWRLSQQLKTGTWV